MDILALYDIHGNIDERWTDALEAVEAAAAPELRRTSYDAARAGARILAAGWPDEGSVTAALIEPVEAIVVTRLLEGLDR